MRARYVASLPFLKMQGTGNEILVVDNRTANVDTPSADTIIDWGSPVRGLGFDQLMWIDAAANANAAYRVFNADGGEVEQCGNGLRCVAWYLAREGALDLTLESPAGVLEARVDDDDVVAVSMGVPEFLPARIPFIADAEALRYEIDVDGETLTISALSMGNPHAVLDVESTDSAPVARFGALLERHERFPQRANVGFMTVADRGRIDLRVFERGVGETLACGTGACAAAISGIRRGLLDNDVTVQMPGGQLMVSWRGENAWLSGAVTLEREGRLTL